MALVVNPVLYYPLGGTPHSQPHIWQWHCKFCKDRAMASPGEEPTAAPAASTLQLTPEETNIIKARRAAREDSPTKKCKQEQAPTADEWRQFLDALAAKNFELGDLDPQLCNLLTTSEEARDDFLALNLLFDDTQHFDQQTGTLQKLNLSKKRPFESTWPTLEVQEQNIEDAMRQYHQSTVLPSFQVLWYACKQFYANTSLANYFSHMRMDMQDSRLTTLEARLGRRSILIKGLPARGVPFESTLPTLEGQEQTIDSWDIDIPKTNLARINIIPWDYLMATSMLWAIDDAQSYHLTKFDPQDFGMDYIQILQSTFKQDHHQFYEACSYLATFMEEYPMFLDIFLGNDPYTNEYLQVLSALCSCFTDTSYWQNSFSSAQAKTKLTTSSSTEFSCWNLSSHCYLFQASVYKTFVLVQPCHLHRLPK